MNEKTKTMWIVTITLMFCGVIWYSGYWWCDQLWRGNLVERGLMEIRGGINGEKTHVFTAQTPTGDWQSECVKRGCGEWKIDEDRQIQFVWK